MNYLRIWICLTTICLPTCVAFASFQTQPPAKEKQIEGLKALKHPDPAVRYRSVEVLGKLGTVAKFALPELREVLQDSDGRVRVKAAESLWKIDPASANTILPVLLAALKDKEPSVRAAAPNVLAQMGPKAKISLKPLTSALKDSDLTVRMEVISALGELGSLAKNSASDLLALIKDKDFPLLEPMVCVALGNLGPEIVPTLIQALREKESASRRVAAYSLGLIGPGAKNAVPSLTARLNDSEGVVRSLSAQALGKIGPEAKSALPALSKLLQDPQPTVRIDAAETLWILDRQLSGLPILIQIIQKEADGEKERSCRVLAQMGPLAQSAIPTLGWLLKHSDSVLRRSAAFALGKFGPEAKTHLPGLNELLKDEETSVRLVSAQAIWWIGKQTENILPILEKILYDENDEYRLQAAGILGEVGPEAKSAFGKLLSMFQDEEETPAIRRAFAQALKQIDPKEAAKAGIK